MIRSCCMIGACAVCFDHAHNPLCQVAHINELHSLIRLPGRQYFASLSNAMGPVGKAVSGIVRAYNQPGTSDEYAPGHRLCGGLLAQGLQWAVSRVGNLFHSCILQRAYRSTFICAWLAEIGIDGDAGNKCVVLNGVSK